MLKIIAMLCMVITMVLSLGTENYQCSDCIIGNSTNDGIAFQGTYNSITINEGVTITPGSDNIGIRIGNNTTTVTTLTNNGTVAGFLQLYGNNNTITTLNNNGIIYGILNNNANIVNGNNTISTLNNYGYIYLSNLVMDKGKYAHIRNINGAGNTINIYIANYHIHIDEDSSSFNNFSGYNSWSDDTSHLVIAGGNNDDNVNGVTIDSNSKFLISIGQNFSLNTDYSLAKLITNAVGNKFNLKTTDQSSVDDLYPYLTLSIASSVLSLSRGGASDTFQIIANTDNSIGNQTIKSNIASINTLRNQISLATFGDYYRDIYNTGSYSQRISLLQQAKQRSRYIAKKDNVLNATYADSKSAEIIRVASVNRELRNRGNKQSSINDDFYFFFSPFVYYTDFYNGSQISGISYGLVSGFNAKIGSSNTLGFHFGASYGNMDDAKNGTTTLDMESITLILGLHYKLDLAYQIYIKAFLEGYFFMNDVSYIANATYNQSPSSGGYGVSLQLGKAFCLNNYGTLEAEVGISYSGMQTPKMSFVDLGEYYEGKLIHLPYAGIDVNYHKVFLNGLGFDLTLGAKKLIWSPRANMTTYGIRLAYDISTDSIFAYGGVGLKYLINSDVELGLQYLGNLGDQSHSHTGFFNVRVWW